jgi:hypothetical protein
MQVIALSSLGTVAFVTAMFLAYKNSWRERVGRVAYCFAFLLPVYYALYRVSDTVLLPCSCRQTVGPNAYWHASGGSGCVKS